MQKERKGKFERVIQAELRLRVGWGGGWGGYLGGCGLLQCVGLRVYQIVCVCLIEPVSRRGNPSCSVNAADLRPKQRQGVCVCVSLPARRCLRCGLLICAVSTVIGFHQAS